MNTIGRMGGTFLYLSAIMKPSNDEGQEHLPRTCQSAALDESAEVSPSTTKALLEPKKFHNRESRHGTRS